VRRTIVSFGQDDRGDWVADLSCLHRQHVRHQPPFRDRPWVLEESGRAAHIGSELDCPLCDRAELPDDLRVARTAGPFDEASIPAGLRRDHRVAPSTWGVLRVLDGSVELSIETDPPLRRRLRVGGRQPIPPDVAHHLTVEGRVQLAVDFLVRVTPSACPPGR
jgi:hypothetical protein